MSGEARSREARLSAVVGGVVAAAVREAGARGLALLDDGSPEARLAAAWCRATLGSEGVRCLAGEAAADVESALQRERGRSGGGTPRGEHGDAAQVVAEEARRAVARVRAGTDGLLLANPMNKTALLLAPRPVPEPLLPLGDLWASQVHALAGGWSAPQAVRALAEAAGGIAALDGALAAWCDRRQPLREALTRLPEAARPPVAAALEAGRFARRYVGLVPKLGSRTPGIDLFA